MERTVDFSTSYTKQLEFDIQQDLLRKYWDDVEVISRRYEEDMKMILWWFEDDSKTIFRWF